jgi:hypothetical protein
MSSKPAGGFRVKSTRYNIVNTFDYEDTSKLARDKMLQNLR